MGSSNVAVRSREWALVAIGLVATVVAVVAPAAGAPPELIVDGTVVHRGSTVVVEGPGCEHGEVDVYLYSGSGPTRILAGFGEAEAGDASVLIVPGWIALDAPLTLEGTCRRASAPGSDELATSFRYAPRPLELGPDLSPVAPVVGTFDRTTAAMGQAVSFSGGDCTLLSATGSPTAGIVVFAGGDVAEPGAPLALGSGTVTDGDVDAGVVLLAAGLEPGPHVAVPFCTSAFEGFQTWPPVVVTVEANPAVDSVTLTSDAAGHAVVRGAGCHGEAVELLLHGEGSSEAASVGPTDGSWTFDWTGGPTEGAVEVDATCGDPASDGFAYRAARIVLSPSEPSPSTTALDPTGVDPAAAPAARPVRGRPGYTG